jgi:adenosylmethionine-8-amino-7-oxononanoate aminotransferase
VDVELHYPSGHVFYRNLHRSYPFITHGKGAYLYDFEGKRYLDASGGAAVANIGHGVEEIAAALSAQAGKLGYLNGLQFSHSPVESLAENIAGFLPFPNGKVYFLTSGAEAVEASIKLARQYWVEHGKTNKHIIISRRPSYHGGTLASLALSARESYKTLYQPMLRESQLIPAPYCYRCFCNETYPDCGLKCAHELEKKIRMLGEEKVSAFITEVIGGASTGAAVPPPEYFNVIRKICDAHNVFLIADEIMTGIGRTGEWLACNHFDLKPDIILLGKGLAGGYIPLSALAARKEIVDTIYARGHSFSHALTFAHHPIGCAAGVATLAFIEENRLLAKCNEMGHLLEENLLSLESDSHVGDIRGQGLLYGIEFVRKKSEKTPFPRENRYTERFLDEALKRGLVLWSHVGHADGINGDLVLLAPPFTVTPEEIMRIKEILSDTLEATEKK